MLDDEGDQAHIHVKAVGAGSGQQTVFSRPCSAASVQPTVALDSKGADCKGTTMKFKSILFVALALTTTMFVTAPATAAPKPTIDIQLFCGDEPIDVSVSGNGDWTPAHDLNSNLVGVPIAFGTFEGVFTPTGGDPQPFTEAPFAKRNVPRTRNLIIECSYTINGSFPDGSFTGTGSVTLMVPRIH